MQIFTDAEACPAPVNGCVVTIGVYDGVHLGHRAVIDRVKAMAADLGAATAIVTFDRHPAVVVRPDSAPSLLTDLDQRLELLDSTGIDYALVLRFDEERAAETAGDFVTEILAGCLRARAVVVGHDFHFGKSRQGNVPLLQEMGADLGFDVLGLTLVPDADEGEVVSSTRVRSLLNDGDVDGAARLLGRSHEVRGVVQEGDRRGRDLGFPTANVAVPASIQLPADGIYAGWYGRPDGSVLPTAISLGRRPTFYEQADASLLECHILDFAGNLYGEQARVRFVARLRGEEKFESVDALVEQIGRDVEDTRRVLAR
ncbi:MAG: bifunctional riboflavin kinase/FAD synthetase [Acidimicrobiales bacterium]